LGIAGVGSQYRPSSSAREKAEVLPYRLLPQPGGFEGFCGVDVGLDAHG
jgi:hypothetical protein